jgi:hypothetical protein
MWGLIFMTEFAFAVATFVYALTQDEILDNQSLFNQCSCVAGAFIMASLWSALFAEERKWTFVLSSVLLVVTAVIATAGAVVSKPFFVHEWYVVFGGIATTFFSGWTIVAAGLSVGITTRVYNHGMDAAERKESKSSLWPLVLSVLTAILAIVLANPIFPVPLLLTLPFVPGVLKDWKVWVPAIVCVAGVALGAVMVFVYREALYPF